ncbi:MAG: CHASE domain-containing protein [Chloroflexota bacterium]
MLRMLFSVRGKILLSIGLLTVLIVVTLFVFITSLQGAADQARVIDAAGEIKTSSVNIDLLTREITTTSTNNQNVILAIESVLRDDARFIDSITHFFNGSQFVSRNEFAAYMPYLNKEFRSNRTEFPEILAAIYAPAISKEGRSTFEASIAEEGYPGFHVAEWNSSQQQIPADSRDSYFPVEYIVPFDVNRATSFGIDLGATPLVREILDQARNLGQPLILPNTPFKLSHSERDYTFWIVAPVYKDGDPETVLARQAQLQGYLILSIDGESLVQAATSRLVQRSVVLQISDIDAPADTKPIFVNSRLNLAPASGLITASFPLEILGKRWSVTLAQGIDVVSSLANLSETAVALDQRIALLQAGAMSLTDLKRTDISSTALSDAYTKMADRNKTLQKNIQTFLQATNNSDQEGLLPALQDNALAVFQSSTDFVDTLEQELELRVEQAIQISGLVAAVALIIITAGFILVRQILQNLSHLNRAALSLADGHLDERVKVDVQDEIGHIATSMNLMASQLQELISTLEHRVTERTRDLEIARKHAEQASKAKSVFLSNMSHELRTPLTVIIGYSRSMLNKPKMFDGIPIPTVHRPFVQLIEENGQYLVGLINDILDLSKIEAGKLDLHCSSIDLAGVMLNVVATAAGLLKDKPVQIRQEFDDTLPRVWADPNRLRQICLNLMSNAIKFTTSGSVTLTAREEGDFVRISVIDTGIGIPEEALATIFNRFEQAQHDTDQQYGGTGLGLNISKQLCMMQGGELTVQSVVGQGSTFSFTIPVLSRGEQVFLPIVDVVDNPNKRAKSGGVLSPLP